MSETSAEAFGRGAVEVLQSVVDAARIELGMKTHDLVGLTPEGLVGDQPRPLALVQLGWERIHDRDYVTGPP
jgi:hypothetical protein